MKVGILTHYYNSVNYGGNLQAYALCKAVENLGHEAQQVQVVYTDAYKNLLNPNAERKRKAIKLAKKPAQCLAWTVLPGYRAKCRRRKAAANQLQQAFHHFNQELTPHSQKLYTKHTIKKALKEYDAFITGSDQVWNPIWYFEPFFLTFAPASVPKMAYAASIAQETLPPAVADRYRANLRDFIGVSVREEKAQQLLAPTPASYVLDPTFLLSKEDWLQVASPRLQEKPYLFCYFLGDDLCHRQAAAQYAKAHDLTLVTIPNAAGQHHVNDAGFGDVQLAEPSPEDFLGLIAHADQVFTDSFHASVFSLIFQRQFAVFPRLGHEKMSQRLYSLTQLYDIPERFCDTVEKISAAHIDTLLPIDYTQSFPKAEQLKAESVRYLEENLDKAKKMLSL